MTGRSYAQLARTVEWQTAAMAGAMLELDTALANLEAPAHVDVAVAAVARARARLRGDALHERKRTDA